MSEKYNKYYRENLHFDVYDKFKLLLYKRILNGKNFDFKNIDEIFDLGKNIYLTMNSNKLEINHTRLIKYLENELIKEDLVV